MNTEMNTELNTEPITLFGSTVINWKTNNIGNKINCQQIITIIVKNNLTHSNYDISYKWKYETDDNHPFYNDIQFFNTGHNDGEIIAKNSLSDILVEYLLMDNDTLSQKSGFSTPEFYRMSIIQGIKHFWD